MTCGVTTDCTIPGVRSWTAAQIVRGTGPRFGGGHEPVPGDPDARQVQTPGDRLGRDTSTSVEPGMGAASVGQAVVCARCGGYVAREMLDRHEDFHDDIRQAHALFVPPEEIRKMIVRVVLIEVAEKRIEAVLPRQPALRSADIAEAPLANERVVIACFLQHAGNGDVSCPQRLRRRIRFPCIAANTRVAVVLTGHEHGSRRRADGGTGVN